MFIVDMLIKIFGITFKKVFLKIITNIFKPLPSVKDNKAIIKSINRINE
ncbi:hypothetical protein QEW_2042 [Clostridioides difficile CD160]|nr:hypothetical protein QEW_2042 [Clostridioides difficile CD160]